MLFNQFTRRQKLWILFGQWIVLLAISIIAAALYIFCIRHQIASVDPDDTPAGAVLFLPLSLLFYVFVAHVPAFFAWLAITLLSIQRKGTLNLNAIAVTAPLIALLPYLYLWVDGFFGSSPLDIKTYLALLVIEGITALFYWLPLKSR